jgi:hypothetical protein
MNVDVEMTFRTTRPLAQETGLEMWQHGSWFGAVKNVGGSTYKLVTGGEAVSLTDAISAIGDNVRDVVERDGHNSATIIDVKASRV